ncbi:hypothetical protein IW262DRAFT_870643 [Armillaria fumosa]|nr:hypothetical protein IW262DRAFT_870643 [Armillaria fumosa]
MVENILVSSAISCCVALTTSTLCALKGYSRAMHFHYLLSHFARRAVTNSMRPNTPSDQSSSEEVNRGLVNFDNASLLVTEGRGHLSIIVSFSHTFYGQYKLHTCSTGSSFSALIRRQHVSANVPESRCLHIWGDSAIQGNA